MSTNAYKWVPSVYLMQGLPFTFVATVSSVIYKNFGFNNSEIAFYTSLFTLPWILKFFLAPALENIASKKTMIFAMQFIFAILTLVLATSFYLTNYLDLWFYLTCFIFSMTAVVGAIHDINADGLYLAILDYPTQARFIGVRTVCYHLGRLLCQAGVIVLAGILIEPLGKEKSWELVLFLLSILLFFIAYYNKKSLPQDITAPQTTTLHSYKNVITEFRKLPHLTAVIIFILFYQLPDTQTIKIIPLFMLDKIEQGGLGLSVDQVGLISGGIGVVTMLLGVTVSGFLLARLTLKKCLVPFTIISALLNLSYLFIVFNLTLSLWQITLFISLAQFGFGLSNGIYMFYLVTRFSHQTYSMSLYAMGTAIMLLGAMIAGGISGYLQSILGYQYFFIWIALLGLFMTIMAVYNAKKIL